MKSCVLCKIRYQKGSGVTFHSFPADSKRQKLWLKGIQKRNMHINKYDYLCSRHFSEDCFIRHHSGNTTLKKCSVPTVLVNSDDQNTSGPLQNTALVETRVKEECDDDPPIHEEIVASTPSVSETIIVMHTPSSSLCDNDQSTICDPQQKIDMIRVQIEVDDDPTIHEEMSPKTSSSETRIVSPTPSSLRVHDRRRSKSCEPQKSIPSNNVRSLSLVRNNVNHDHRYVDSTKSTNEALRVKTALQESRNKVKVLTQHVKRLKATVAKLRNVIKEMKRTK